MLVFWEQRLVVLATPKTGSTALEVALESLASLVVDRPPVLKHTPAYRYHRFLRPYFERSAGAPFTVVALIREPLAWLGSWYRYRQREEIAGTPQATGGLSFDTFLEGYMAPDRPAFADVGTQARFLSGDDGLGVDMLFRYEDIAQFVAFLEDRLDCVIELPWVNMSPAGPLTVSAPIRERLSHHAAEDFALHAATAQGPLAPGRRGADPGGPGPAERIKAR